MILYNKNNKLKQFLPHIMNLEVISSSLIHGLLGNFFFLKFLLNFQAHVLKLTKGDIVPWIYSNMTPHILFKKENLKNKINTWICCLNCTYSIFKNIFFNSYSSTQKKNQFISGINTKSDMINIFLCFIYPCLS